MKDPIDTPCVSSVEPIFTMAADQSVCTRTWEHDSDPKLSQGEVVKLGKTACKVIEKVTHTTKAGIYLITYQFSPADL